MHIFDMLAPLQQREKNHPPPRVRRYGEICCFTPLYIVELLPLASQQVNVRLHSVTVLAAILMYPTDQYFS